MAEADGQKNHGKCGIKRSNYCCLNDKKNLFVHGNLRSFDWSEKQNKVFKPARILRTGHALDFNMDLIVVQAPGYSENISANADALQVEDVSQCL